MKFRPCIDLHEGVVKQIVGSTLEEKLITNFQSDHTPGWYSQLYKKDRLWGGHIIKLGPNNDEAANEALSAWPEGMQLGGGINDQNAIKWLEAGASALIVTSYVFKNGQIYEEHLKKLADLIGKKRLVLDLSCRKKEGKYWVVTDRWQNFTQVEVNISALEYFSQFCCEFLIHAVDVEGKCNGIESNLVQLLGKWGEIPITYAGGVQSWKDIETIKTLGKGKIDFTVGSALDLFGGKGLCYQDLIQDSSIS